MKAFLAGVLATVATGVVVGAALADEDLIIVQVRMKRERYEECLQVSCGFLTPAQVQEAYNRGVEEGVKAYKENHLDFHGCTKDDA